MSLSGGGRFVTKVLKCLFIPRPRSAPGHLGGVGCRGNRNMGRNVVAAGGAALFLFLAIGSVLSLSGGVRAAPTIDRIVIVDGPGGARSLGGRGGYMFRGPGPLSAAGDNTT